eukprot:gene11895-24922_t
MSMSLVVEVSAIGICRGFPPYGIFVVNVQKETSQVWTVYRRFSSFVSLYEQLKSLSTDIPEIPRIDERDISLEHMESARGLLSIWLETILRDECILRTQSMYQFLCADANMPPPYVDIHWKTRNEVNFNEDDMDMDFMYDKNTSDDIGDHNFEDEGDENNYGEIDNEPEVSVSHNMSSSWRQSGSKRTASHSAASYRKQVDLKESAEDVAEGLDIQSLSMVEAEFLYDCDQPNQDNTLKLNFETDIQQEIVPTIPRRIISLDSFEIIKVIGKGSFGKVFLVRDKAKKSIHAMKVLKKDYIIKKNQVEHTKTERSVLGYVKHPYIVGLTMAFQTSDKLFFVLDYCSGNMILLRACNNFLRKMPKASNAE